MKIGDKIYIFDMNRRIYPKNNSSAPIYREHFVEREIVAETSRSWIIGYHGCKGDERSCWKTPKNKPLRIYTLKQVDEQIYLHDNSYKIADLVQRTSYENLKKIAEILGYNASPSKGE